MGHAADVSRRTFLRSAGATGLLVATTGLTWARNSADAPTPSTAHEVFLPDSGWRLWPDNRAAWQDDKIFLPDEVVLNKLPVNLPTGGWSALSSTQGIEVTLPATVEQFYWGAFGYRPYKDEYKFEADDPEVKNGSYRGVSWWWRDIEVPQSFQSKRIFLHIRAARLRAEVYLNQKLVGYSILEELPFECDITDAARPGKMNQLAVRITNPGGEMDWIDNRPLPWGEVTIQRSHGFGGLDRALSLTAHDEVRIEDCWVLNTSAPQTVSAHVVVRNSTDKLVNGTLKFSVVDLETKKIVARQEQSASLQAGGSATFTGDLHHPAARLWDLETPFLYELRAEWKARDASISDLRKVRFGFRWFAPEGIGDRAIFRLNGRRMRIYTSISWGFWGLNGLFPTPELAQKEVDAAREFHLNCLNFHRNPGKKEVLEVQDARGLLRCMEPGGGYQAVGPAGRPATFAQRYMEAKIVRMVRTFRSHPSLVEYILQNEAKPDLENPNLQRVLKLMHQEDPSRTIVANDGFASRAPQAWMEPYSDRVRTSAEGGAGGWWVEHQGPFSDVWNDRYYSGPDDFLYRSANRAEIVEWGEMKGAASPDDHQALIRQIEKHGAKSYDLADHKEVLAAYENFLDKYGFRKAFPDASSLFTSISRRAYESWAQFMENVRICDENDYAAISGWESTSIENHSGLVDNMRDFKSAVAPLAKSLLPVRPVAKQRHLVIKTGDQAVFDLYLLNDSGRPVTGKLSFSLTDPAGKSQTLGEYDSPKYDPDKLSYLVQPSVSSPPLATAGMWQTSLQLSTAPSSAHACDLWVVDPCPYPLAGLKVGFIGPDDTPAQFKGLPGVEVVPFRPEAHYDLIFAGEAPPPQEPVVPTDDMGAYRQSGKATEVKLPDAVIEQLRNGTPLLAVTGSDGPALGYARQLADAGAFKFQGMVGASRASWMGSWYFVREHALYAGLPVDQGMSIHYQVKGSGSNGWLVDSPDVEVVAAYSRDHARSVGAGTFTAVLGRGHIVMHRIASMHPLLQQRFLANAMAMLCGRLR